MKKTKIWFGNEVWKNVIGGITFILEKRRRRKKKGNCYAGLARNTTRGIQEGFRKLWFNGL